MLWSKTARRRAGARGFLNKKQKPGIYGLRGSSSPSPAEAGAAPAAPSRVGDGAPCAPVKPLTISSSGVLSGLFVSAALWLTDGGCALGIAEVKPWTTGIKQGRLLYLLLLEKILIIIQLPHTVRAFCKRMRQVRVWDT